ncbi:MAG: hypothetical protein Q8M11_19745 [Sulfuritalea sp.]|nr:hypothetical protein [Sulfuritalea sp.]MDP1985042.1 hypothetical protein [Sulfuritalea sp.]
MVDEIAFRHTREEINRLPCVFERALLARHSVCDLAASHQIAERESVACTEAAAHAACARMSELLREKSSFALGLTATQRILPHAMMMKIQCGGLDGLKALLDAGAEAPEVHRLLRLAQEGYGDLAALPFSEIVQGVAAWKSRRRHPGAPR